MNLAEILRNKSASYRGTVGLSLVEALRGFSKTSSGEDKIHHPLYQMLHKNRSTSKVPPHELDRMIRDLIHRLNTDPSSIGFVGADGKQYRGSPEAVKKLPRSIALTIPGDTSHHILENYNKIDPVRMGSKDTSWMSDDHKKRNPRWAYNTVRTKAMDHYVTDKRMALERLFRAVTGAPSQAMPGRKKKLSPKEYQKEFRRAFGFTGEGWKDRWNNLLKAVEARQAEIPKSHPLAVPRVEAPGFSANRTRKLTRAVASGLSKGKIKMASATRDRLLRAIQSKRRAPPHKAQTTLR